MPGKIKRCRNCQRKQYVKKAICICGYIPYEDTLDSESLKEFRLDQMSKKITTIALSKRRQFLELSLPIWKRFIVLHKHNERRKLHIPVHSTHYLGHTARFLELKKYNQARAKDRKKTDVASSTGTYLPTSIRKKVEEAGYLTELAIDLQKQKNRSNYEDLETMQKQYIKIRAINVNLSGKTTAAINFSGDINRRRKIVKNQAVCTSRKKALLNINDANNIEEIVNLLKKENDLLIKARMSRKNPDWLKRQKMTREQLIKERAMRKADEKNAAERHRLQMELAMSESEKKKAMHERASYLLSTFLRNWQLEVLLKSWRQWNAKEPKDTSKEAMRVENVEVAKHHQKMGLARRLRQLVKGISSSSKSTST